MGKQVNFYLIPSDILMLESKLREVGPLLVLHSRSDVPRPRVLESLEHMEQGKLWLYFFLVRPENLDEVVMRHVPAQGYWVVDELKSPVIQLNRSFFDGKNLRRGRIYFIERYFGENREMVHKPDAFRAWAKAILDKAKRNLVKIGPEYIGADTKTWLDTSHGTLLEG